MGMAARLMMELAALQRESDHDEIVLYPANDSDIQSWVGFIRGPTDTPFSNGTFELSIDVPSNYPLQPPKIKFVTKVFHPNVHFKTGEICIDVLKDAWSAVYTLQSTLRSLIALLSLPAADSPLNCDAGNLLRSGDERGFNSVARMYTLLHASTPFPLPPWNT